MLHLGDRRQSGGRCGVRESGACDQARPRQQSARPQRNRAARGRRVVQPRRRSVHALRLESESARRTPVDDGVRAGPSRAQGPRDRARRWRRLRLEDLSVRGRNGDGMGFETRRPADQMGRRAQRVISVRCAWPRSHHACRARDGQGRQVSRASRQHDGERRRVSLDVCVVHSDDPLRDAARRSIHDAGDPLRSDGGLHQHGAG